jgi:hypothetical protein
VNVVAKDVCGNVAAAAAKIIVEQPATPTPTPTATPAPTAELTGRPPQATAFAVARPTEVIVALPPEEIELEAALVIVPYQFPLWLWALLVSAMILGAGGIFIDPRPKRVNRLADVRKESINLFVEMFED